MASTVPAKSHPLHNFSLPHLKWNNKDGQSSGGSAAAAHHQRGRRSVKSPSRRPNAAAMSSPLRQSPLRDSVSATPPRLHSPLRDSVSAMPPRLHSPMRDSVSATPPRLHSPMRDCGSPARLEPSPKHSPTTFGGEPVDHRRNQPRNLTVDSEKTEMVMAIPSTKRSKAAEIDDSSAAKRSKILIKIPRKSSKLEEENPQEELTLPKIGEDDERSADEVLEEGKISNNNDEETKTWNLRPRKPIRKSLNVNGGSGKTNMSTVEKSKAQSPSRNLNSSRSGENEGINCGNEKKEKKKLSVLIPLTKDEIEEDVFALTGSKPARRPKKRPKSVQKQVDFVFPGLWLVSINADSYKVSENSLKG